MDDPTGPTLHRVSGQTPFPDPGSPGLPADILPRQVTLRDRQTVATIVPFASRHQLPPSLLVYLCDQLNREIEGGDTYPMMDPFGVDGFADYWFQTFGAVMLLGNLVGADDVAEGRDWAKECLGSFFIKPNYPGRSSHICNASFIVTDGSRNRGVGRLMGEAYLDWAPRLGYTYSVFNLVYETNVASIRIWDALGFKRIGRVKACGNLRSHPDRLIDAIIYGRDLGTGGGGDADELVSEERFDKIRYYLKYAKYPNGADRAEKSRLRSAATHYKLLDGDKLMLKDKEVIADPARQYEIARDVHALHHGGINKTTATIAERYHWSRIKETVSDVIRACVECKELGKTPNPGGNRKTGGGAAADGAGGQSTTERVLALQQNHNNHNNHGLMSSLSQPGSTAPSPSAYANPSDISVLPSHTLQSSTQTPADHLGHHHLGHHHHHHHHHNPMLQDPPTGHHPSPVYQPIDPQIINHHHHHH
ncbi:Protein SPT10, partial [Tolypocladium paradoxum]